MLYATASLAQTLSKVEKLWCIDAVLLHERVL